MASQLFLNIGVLTIPMSTFHALHKSYLQQVATGEKATVSLKGNKVNVYRDAEGRYYALTGGASTAATKGLKPQPIKLSYQIAMEELDRLEGEVANDLTAKLLGKARQHR